MSDAAYDPVFPLPEPDFLWVHDLTLVGQTSASTVVDEATGRWHYGEAAPSTTFTGYIGSVGRRETERAAARGIVADAVVLAPHSLPLAPDTAELHRLVCGPDSKATRWLHGSYKVSEVRPNASHLRLILTRLVGDTVPHEPPRGP